MPTIIDSLVVMLGLDSKDMESKAPAATRKLADLEKQGNKTEAEVKKLTPATKSAAKGFDEVARSIGAVLAVIGGAAALKVFIEDTITAGAALDRLSKNLNLDVGTITAWGNAAEQLGGSAKGLQASFATLAQAQQDFLFKGETSALPVLSKLGVALLDVGGKTRPVTDILLDLSSAVEKFDRPKANYFLKSIGLDQDSANLILIGRRELELMIKRQKEFADEQRKFAPEAQKLQIRLVELKQKFELLGLTLLEKASPAIETVLGWMKKLGDWLNRNSEFVGDFLKVLAAGLVAVTLATSPLALTTAAVIALAGAIALLWQDYQVWKRGGDSLIDWGKWEPAITLATKGVSALGHALEFAWNQYSKFHDLPIMDKMREKLGVKNTDDVMSNIKKWNDAHGVTSLGVQQRYQRYFEKQGRTPEQAAGIAVNLWAESGALGPRAIGDNGKAYGVAQWHPDRQAQFKALYGKDIHDASEEEQLAFVQYELTKGTRKWVGDALGSKTDAFSSGSLISRGYEGPKDVMGEAYRRGKAAELLAGMHGASASVAAASSSRAGTSTTNHDDHSSRVDVGTINIHTQATDADGIMRDIQQSKQFLFAGQAVSGLN